VVYTGRLLRGKGLEGLLDAFADLARRRPAHLVLVGSGAGQSLSVEETLRSRVAAEGLAPRVTFTGRVDDVAPWLRAADVFVFPSAFEALGLSLLEAAACGLPLVGSRTGGIVDVIAEGRSGRLVPPSDTASLRAVLEELLADEPRRIAFGQEARASARARFDLGDNVAAYRALFAELAARRRRPRAA
jgi:glycosyltransferase involved in cell wall biosynthesis